MNSPRKPESTPEPQTKKFPHHRQLSESDWIRRLTDRAKTHPLVKWGLPQCDDAACFQWPSFGDQSPNELVCLSSDCIVQDSHFINRPEPEWVAQRLIYAGISDLYAMGARPLYLLLNVVDHTLDEVYYTRLLDEIFSVMDGESLQLLGGNTSKGDKPQYHIFTLGAVPADKMTTRSGAKPGDYLILTGAVGVYALARTRWCWSEMRLPRLGSWLEIVREFATSAIDISDGLIIDCRRLAKASSVSIHLWLNRLYGAEPFRAKPTSSTLDLMLWGGEDYVLCMTVSEKNLNNKELNKLSPIIIGKIESGSGVRLYSNPDEVTELELGNGKGFDHFK